MASSSPRTATSWLLTAANKLENSIYRRIDYKYRNIISTLTTRVKELEKRVEDINDEAIRYEDIGDERLKQIHNLEAKLRAYEKPVATKDLREEIFRVKTLTEQIISEESTKVLVEAPKDINIISSLRDDPASKILEIGPPPRSILPLPVTYKKSKKRERSTSPKPEPRTIRAPILQKEKVNQPVPSAIPLSPHPFRTLAYPPVTSTKKIKRKRKREKDEKDEKDDS